MTFEEWFEEFKKQLAKQSGWGRVPNGLTAESFREDYEKGISPADRARQELDDLSR